MMNLRRASRISKIRQALSSSSPLAPRVQEMQSSTKRTAQKELACAHQNCAARLALIRSSNQVMALKQYSSPLRAIFMGHLILGAARSVTFAIGGSREGGVAQERPSAPATRAVCTTGSLTPPRRTSSPLRRAAAAGALLVAAGVGPAFAPGQRARAPAGPTHYLSPARHEAAGGAPPAA